MSSSACKSLCGTFKRNTRDSRNLHLTQPQPQLVLTATSYFSSWHCNSKLESPEWGWDPSFLRGYFLSLNLSLNFKLPHVGVRLVYSVSSTFLPVSRWLLLYIQLNFWQFSKMVALWYSCNFAVFMGKKNTFTRSITLSEH